MLRHTASLALFVALFTIPVFAADSERGSSRLANETVVDAVRSSMDSTADPCVDFYRFACGSWLDNNEIPGDQTRWGRSFSTIAEANREIIRGILEDAAREPGESVDRQRIGRFYGSCMDEATIESAGLAPLAPLFESIATLDDPARALPIAGGLERSASSLFLGLGVLPDFQDPGTNIAFLSQGGLGMPDRDYYTSTDPGKQALLASYTQHVATMLALSGVDATQAAADAQAVVAFETRLAEASRPRQEMRNADKIYNKIDREGLEKLTPRLDWQAYFEATGHPGIQAINVAVPEFFEALEATVFDSDAATLRAYMRWSVVHALADTLPAAIVDADFQFFSRELSGQQEIEPRWKRCVGATQRAMGEIVGRIFVEEHFAGSSRDVAIEMIEDIEAAFDSSLPDLGWMDDATRDRAREKLEAITNKIGYPDQWKTYEGLTVADAYAANQMRANAFRHDYELAKVGQPVDHAEWRALPQIVNAYYNPLNNEIVFPAGILQPPFFHRDQPAAMNYGAIGAVMGHEVSHGFDDSGRRFDPSGRLREWWAPAAIERFESQAACVDKTYSAFEVEPGQNVNGKLTLGENIADLGGVKRAFEAFQQWQERNGEPAPLLEALSNDQLFFVSYGQVWCALQTPEVARLRLTTDSHSPPRFRVNGALSQVPAFAEAFACEPGEPMAPVERCEVW